MAPQERFGCAIHGAGNVATEHLRAYLKNPHCEVVAIGGRTRESAAGKARQVGLDPSKIGIYDSIDQLVRHPGLDIVSITTPPDFHANDTIAAARAGKHVVIEKPVAISPDELRRMAAAVKEAGVRTVVSFVLRWNPMVDAAKALIAQGFIGRPLLVQTDYWHNGLQSRYPRKHRDYPLATISAMLGGGCHAVDMARYLVESDIVEVTAIQFGSDQSQDFHSSPANQAALVRFANGAAGKVTACTEQWAPYQFNIDLLGADGALRDNRFYSRKMPGVMDWASFPTIVPNSGSVDHHPFQGEVNHFVECIRSGVESHCNLADAVNTHEACFAIDQSGRAGFRPVKLPLG